MANPRGHKIGCGCCVGPVEDRCCCHFHQDIPHGIAPKLCSLHCEPVFDQKAWIDRSFAKWDAGT